MPATTPPYAAWTTIPMSFFLCHRANTSPLFLARASCLRAPWETASSANPYCPKPLLQSRLPFAYWMACKWNGSTVTLLQPFNPGHLWMKSSSVGTYNFS